MREPSFPLRCSRGLLALPALLDVSSAFRFDRQFRPHKRSFFRERGLAASQYPDAMQSRFEKDHRHHHDQYPSDSRIKTIVENQAGVGSSSCELTGVGEKSYARVGVE